MYAIVLALLLAVLKIVDYQFLVINNAFEIYAGIIALIFTVVGIWAGKKLTSSKEIVRLVEKPVIITERPNEEFRQRKMEEFSISKREAEVLDLMEKGLSNQEIAATLYISLSSVKTYVTRIFQKLNVERRTQAVQKAKSEGLI